MKPITDKQVQAWRKAIRDSYRAIGEEIPESDIAKLIRAALEAAIVSQLDEEVAAALQAPSKKTSDD